MHSALLLYALLSSVQCSV